MASRRHHPRPAAPLPGSQPAAAAVGTDSSSSSSLFQSPYYSTTTFTLLSPLAIVYTLTIHAWRMIVQSRFFLWPNINNNHNHKNGERLVPHPPPPRPNQQPQGRRIALITGSNTGIGYATAYALAVEHNFIVVLACRSVCKAATAAKQIERDGGTAIVVGYPLDLHSLESIQSYVHHLQLEGIMHVDVLINNAGCNSSSSGRKRQSAAVASSPAPATGTDTVDNNQANNNNNNNNTTDDVFQANFLGHFFLTAQLWPLLRRASRESKTPARVIHLSSVMHHFCGDGFRYDQVDAWRQAMTQDTTTTNSNTFGGSVSQQQKYSTYNLSKLAALLFTGELNRRYNSNNNNIISIAVNPGAVASDIWRHSPPWMQTVVKLAMLTPSQGCRPSVAASVLDLPSPMDGTTTTTTTSTNLYYPYLQPYRQPFRAEDDDTNTAATTTTPSSALFPMLEMLGPYQGYRWTTPRLPHDPTTAGQALWQAAVELTGAVWPEAQETTTSS